MLFFRHVRNRLPILALGFAVLACDAVDPIAPTVEPESADGATTSGFGATAASVDPELEYTINWVENGETVSHVVTPVETGGDVAAFYSYGVPNARSANTGYEKAEYGSLFFHRDALTGVVSLVVIYDAPQSTGPNPSTARVHMDGLPTAATFPVLDDGGERPSRNNANIVTIFNQWDGGETDGWAMTGIFGEPMSQLFRIRQVVGLQGLEWVNGDGERIPFPLPTGSQQTHLTVAAGLAQDDSPPVVTPTVTGTLGSNGWYVSDVDVTWSIVDEESGVTATAGCEDRTIRDDTDGLELTCTATSEGGTTTQSVTLKRDVTVPVIQFSGNAGSYGAGDDVAITCTASDRTSGVASADCPEASGKAGDFGLGTHTLTGTATDAAGNEVTTSTSFEVIDITPPVIEPSVTGTLGSNGWYTSDVTVSWSVTDPESDVSSQTGCALQTVDYDTGGETFTCTATSLGGTAEQSVTLKRDATPPTLAFSGNAGSYFLDGAVAIMCDASDALSGIASADCPEAAGPAWSFGAGTTTLDGSATDNAGNTGTGSTVFEVVVTAPGICALVEDWVSNRGVANALCKKLEQSDRSAARGRGNARGGQLNAFANHVDAVRGQWLTDEQADLLLGFASEL